MPMNFYWYLLVFINIIQNNICLHRFWHLTIWTWNVFFSSPCSLGFISSSFRLHPISMEKNATRLSTTHTHRSRIHQLRIILQNVELSVALSMNEYISPSTSILHFPYCNFVHFSMEICWVFVIHIFAVQFIERQGNHMRCPCMQT